MRSHSLENGEGEGEQPRLQPKADFVLELDVLSGLIPASKAKIGVKVNKPDDQLSLPFCITSRSKDTNKAVPKLRLWDCLLFSCGCILVMLVRGVLILNQAHPCLKAPIPSSPTHPFIMHPAQPDLLLRNPSD